MTSDVNGTVVAIQGVAVSSTTPTDGQVLTYVNADSEWEPKAPAGFTPMYGIIYGSYSPGFVSGGTVQQVTMGTTGTTSEVTVSSNDLVCTIAGVVEVTGTVVCSSGITTGSGYVQLYHNGSATGPQMPIYVGASGGPNPMATTVSTLISASASDTFGLYVYFSANTNQSYYGELYLVRVG